MRINNTGLRAECEPRVLKLPAQREVKKRAMPMEQASPSNDYASDDMPEEPEEIVVALQPPKATRCWICENCGSEDVQHFHRFMIEKAHIVDATEMAEHMREHLLASTPEGGGENPERVIPTARDILTHVSKHVLHPCVRVASILRNLLDLADLLRELIMSRADDGTPLIDVRTVTVYLKVITEIMQIYRNADMTKMLFNELEPA